MSTPTILSCKLSTPALQLRKATVIAKLRTVLSGKAELSNGFAYTFRGSDEILDQLNEFIKTERICCDFFSFQLSIEGEKAILTLTGPEGVKEFLTNEIAL
ncbi:MAG TPA: hypothetical protein VD927_17580 [Chryseosolibacter sp.]|nr:hypothetical protein [Chryseosolibacter sp.]